MFDPFEKRISRDIRNQLCNFFLQALEDGETRLFFHRAQALKGQAPDGDHLEFIENRIRRCTEVFAALGIKEPGQPVHSDGVAIAFRLWSRDLFFECHEWLEGLWRRAQGNEKKAIQALIRSVGASVLWEAGRIGPAQSSALKALDLIREFEDFLPPPFRREHLVPGLKKILENVPEKE